MRYVYALLAVIGTVLPWVYFGSYFADAQREPFAEVMLGSPLMTGFVADLSISIVAWLIWSFFDARANRIRGWWLTPVASVTVGLSLALPLYLWMRETARD